MPCSLSRRSIWPWRRRLEIVSCKMKSVAFSIYQACCYCCITSLIPTFAGKLSSLRQLIIRTTYVYCDTRCLSKIPHCFTCWTNVNSYCKVVNPTFVDIMEKCHATRRRVLLMYLRTYPLSGKLHFSVTSTCQSSLSRK